MWIALVTDGIKTVYCLSFPRSKTANGSLIKLKGESHERKVRWVMVNRGIMVFPLKSHVLTSLAAIATVFHMVMRDDYLVNKTLRIFRSWLLPLALSNC